MMTLLNFFPATLAVDWISDKIYWAENVPRAIHLADIHTGSRKKLFSLSAFVNDIIVDSSNR